MFCVFLCRGERKPAKLYRGLIRGRNLDLFFNIVLLCIDNKLHYIFAVFCGNMGFGRHGVLRWLRMKKLLTSL